MRTKWVIAILVTVTIVCVGLGLVAKRVADDFVKGRSLTLSAFKSPNVWGSACIERSDKCRNVEQAMNTYGDTVSFQTCTDTSRIILKWNDLNLRDGDIESGAEGFAIPIAMGLQTYSPSSISKVKYESTKIRSLDAVPKLFIDGVAERLPSEQGSGFVFSSCRRIEFSADGRHLSFALSFQGSAEGRVTLANISSSAVCCVLQYVLVDDQ